MRNVVFTYIMLALLMPFRGEAQSTSQPAIPGYTYHPANQDKASWQRLYLWLSATFLVVANEGQVDIDSCMQAASRSMGVSRYSLLAEGIDDPELAAQAKWIDRQDPVRGIRLLSEVTGKKHLQQLILLGAYYTFQPHNYYKCKDSAEHFLTKAIDESKLLKEHAMGRQALALLVKLYALGNDTKADSLGNVLIAQCRLVKDKETAARMLAYRSKYTPPMATTLERKISDAQQAAELYQSIGIQEGAINALTDLGYLQIIIGQLQPAYKNHLKAMALAEAIDYPYTQYNAQALATVTLLQGKFGEPLRYVYQTVRTAEATRDSVAWGYFYTNMVLMYSLEDRTKEKLEWAQRSVNRFVADRNTSVYRVLNDMVTTNIEQGRAKEAFNLVLDISNKVGEPSTFSNKFAYHLVFSNCYLGIHMPGKAVKHIQQMDSLETAAEAIRGPMRRSEVNFQYGYLFVERKEYRKAKEYFEKQVIAPGGMDGSLGANLDMYGSLLLVDSMLGDHIAAVDHYRKYTKLLDSSFQVSKIRQAEELQVIYQMSEKENQITALKQQTELEKARSDKAALVRNLTIVGICAVLIIAALLYRQNRLKQKNNQVITGKNEQLRQLLTDKEWLLKEVHHRVKNNLQIVISLLDSQSEYINNEAALAAIEDNMRRVHAMALIHQKLYQSDDITTIAMPEYINELVSYVGDSFDTGSRIRFEQTVDPLDLDIAQAIPLGLIINETIVNAIKYAFPGARKGLVRISLYRDGPARLVLEIADNGVGLPEGLNTNVHTSLGFDLMQGLTRQLNGTFSLENDNGLHITIRFPVLNHHFSQKNVDQQLVAG